jgi:signal peptidase I
MQNAAPPEIRYPLLSMWIWPQAAIRRLVASGWRLAALALAALAGVYLTTLLVVFEAPGLGALLESWHLILIGALAGIAALYVAAGLAFLAGRLLGGTATYAQLRRALAWMAIPNSLALTLLAAVGLALSVLGLLVNPSNTALGDAFGVFVLMVLTAPFGLWGLFVSIRALAAVQNFGAIRSALTLAVVCGALWYGVHALGTALDARLPSYVMQNDAMVPAIDPLQRFLLGPLEAPARGDIVVFSRQRTHPHYGIVSDSYVKRVVGLPGEQIGMEGGVLSINGEPVRRQRQGDFVFTGQDGQQRAIPRFTETLPNGVSYDVLDSDPQRTIAGAPVSVPAEHYFVLGDNRDNTEDSPESYQSPAAPVHSGLVHGKRLGRKPILK